MYMYKQLKKLEINEINICLCYIKLYAHNMYMYNLYTHMYNLIHMYMCIQWSPFTADTIGTHIHVTVLISGVSLIQGQFCTELPHLGQKK